MGSWGALKARLSHGGTIARACALAALLFALLPAAGAEAIPTTTLWTDGGNTGLWSTSSNWSNGVPTSTKSAEFDPTQPGGSNANVTIDTPAAALGIEIANYSGTVTQAEAVSVGSDGVSVGAGATYQQSSGTLTVAGNFTLVSGSSFIPDSGTGLDFDGTGTVTDNNSAPENLGNVEVDSGTLSMGSLLQMASLNVTGGTFSQGSGNALDVSGNFTLASGTSFVPGSGSALDFDGSGTVTDNNPTPEDLGNVASGGGTRSMGSSLQMDSLDVASGTFSQGGNTLRVSGNFTLGAAATFVPGSGGGILDFNGPGTVTDSHASPENLGSVESDSGTRSMGSSLQMSSLDVTAGTFSQGTGHTLGVSGNFTLGASATFVPGAGGILDLDGSGTVTDDHTSPNNLGNVESAGATRSMGSALQMASLDVTSGSFAQGNGHTLEVSANFTLASGASFSPDSGSGLLEFDGTGTVTDNNASPNSLGNVESGSGTRSMGSAIRMNSLDVTGGTFTLGTGNALTVASSVAVAGTLDLAGGNASAATITGGGTITDTGAAATLTLTPTGQDTFAGTLAGAVSLRLTGSSTLVLTGNDTASGATTVSGGTLEADGTISQSLVGVSSGATLDGTGTVAGVTLSGGTLAPGDTPGVLTSNGTVDSGSGSTMSFAINGASTPGTDYSQLQGGTVSLGGATLSVTIGYAPHVGDSVTIVSAPGGSISGTFAGLPNGATTNISGSEWQIQYTSTAVTLTDVAPPAPVITSSPPSSTPSTSATFGFSDADGSVTLICQLDEATAAACTSPDTFTGLQPGSHTFSVSAVNGSGAQSSPTRYSWTVTGPPSSSAPPPNCTVRASEKSGGRKSRKHKPPPILTVTVKCDQSVTASVTGVLTEIPKTKHSKGKNHKAKRVTFKLAVSNASMAGGVAHTFKWAIPSAVLTALRHGGKASVTFGLVAANANGRTTGSAGISKLHP